MIFLTFLLIAIIVAAVSIRTKITAIKKEADGDLWATSATFWKCCIVPAIITLFGIFNPFKLERVDAGHVGIKVNLTGDQRGVSRYEYKTGWVIYNKWVSDIYEFPTYQQHIDYGEQQIITRGGFSTSIKPSFNYTIKSGAVGDMFQNLRRSLKEIEKEWLGVAIVSSINDVANKWNVDDIFNQREKFEADIVAEVNKRTSAWFTISQLRTNIIPPKEISESIIAKTRAIQEVQVANNQKLVADAEAQRKIATAKGDSAQAVIAAAGEANAIKLKQLSLTPEYIEYLKVTKWDGQLPTVQSGNAGILMNLPSKP